MASPLHSREVAQVVAELAERVRQIESRSSRRAGTDRVTSGDARLDRLLPDGGFRRGTLVEWLSADRGGDLRDRNLPGSNLRGSNLPGSVNDRNVDRGSGAGTLALIAAREAARQGGAIVVIDRPALFYPPAALRLGIRAEQLIVVRPECDQDTAWALDQVLRTPGVAAAWCAVAEQDEHTLRRWQLAAETGGAIGLLMRPHHVRHEPSWAELRLWVEPLARPREPSRCRRLRVTLARSRFGHAGRSVEIEIPLSGTAAAPHRPAAAQTNRRGTFDETRPVHLAAPVAAAKTRRRARRA